MFGQEPGQQIVKQEQRFRGYRDAAVRQPGQVIEFATALVQLVKRQLGFAQFQLASHDRGARVAHRLVLDHPGIVTRLAILDIVPTRHVLHNVTREMATEYYHWFFLPAGNGIPEHLIGADPAFWIRALIGPLLGEGVGMEPEVMADYIRCFHDPGTIAGSCADYRSAAGIDLVHDDETLAAGQKVRCPVLVLWGKQSFVGRGYEPLSVWQQYATDVCGDALPVGHFLPEEAPDLVTAALRGFFDPAPMPPGQPDPAQGVSWPSPGSSSSTGSWSTEVSNRTWKRPAGRRLG
jgi:haloacetate dehalogenase